MVFASTYKDLNLAPVDHSSRILRIRFTPPDEMLFVIGCLASGLWAAGFHRRAYFAGAEKSSHSPKETIKSIKRTVVIVG